MASPWYNLESPRLQCLAEFEDCSSCPLECGLVCPNKWLPGGSHLCFTPIKSRDQTVYRVFFSSEALFSAAGVNWIF